MEIESLGGLANLADQGPISPPMGALRRSALRDDGAICPPFGFT